MQMDNLLFLHIAPTSAKFSFCLIPLSLKSVTGKNMIQLPPLRQDHNIVVQQSLPIPLAVLTPMVDDSFYQIQKHR